MSGFSNNKSGEFSVENLNKTIKMLEEFFVWLNKQKDVPINVIGAASLYSSMLPMCSYLAEELQPWIDKYNAIKYCCNCKHWTGTLKAVDEYEKCYKYNERGYFEITRFDEYCNCFDLLDYTCNFNDLDKAKEIFGFNPKEFIPKG